MANVGEFPSGRLSNFGVTFMIKFVTTYCQLKGLSALATCSVRACTLRRVLNLPGRLEVSGRCFLALPV